MRSNTAERTPSRGAGRYQGFPLRARLPGDRASRPSGVRPFQQPHRPMTRSEALELIRRAVSRITTVDPKHAVFVNDEEVDYTSKGPDHSAAVRATPTRRGAGLGAISVWVSCM